MPQIRIKRSVEINSSRENAFAAINDFNAWNHWSPWLILEPGCKNTVTEGGKYNEWDGPRLGAGNMRITGENPGKTVFIDLQFLKPWKSRSKIIFEVEESDSGVTVSWIMENKLPFIFFFMKTMMEIYVGMDFERGLRMLKDYVEDGEVHSKLNFIGTEDYIGNAYIGIETECTKETMGQKMSEDLPKIMDYIKEAGLEMHGDVFTQYKKWDMKRNRIVYISGVGVAKLPEQVPHGFIAGRIPATKIYTLEHVGPYHHLGNAWSALYSMQRKREFRLNKNIHPFETYHNHPKEVSENELVTRVHFPVR